MQIAELFVNLGIKGSEKTVGALSNVKKGLGEVGSMSLEAKAGIVAAMYALERLFAASGKTGTDLTNFNALLGVSAKTLQEYQYAARQAGVSNQEVEGSFKALQSTMTKTLMGEGAPKGLARVSMLTGEISAADLKKFAEQPQLLLQKLQQYAGKEKNAGLRNEVLKSFGLGDNMIAALTRNAFRPDILKRAPTYSDKEINSLDKANVAWAELGEKIEMAVGHFNAKHGTQLVSDISKIVEQVVKLAEAFTKLAEKLKIFEQIGKAFTGWTKIFEAVNDTVGKVASNKGGVVKGAVKEGSEIVSGFGLAMKGLFMSLTEGDKYAPAQANAHAPNGTVIPHRAITPSMPKTASATSTKTQNINVNQNLHFQHDGKDHKKTTDSVKKAVQDSYRQMAAQGQGA